MVNKHNSIYVITIIPNKKQKPKIIKETVRNELTIFGKFTSAGLDELPTYSSTKRTGRSDC